MNEPILQLFHPQQPFQVECNASQVAMGAVLQQKNDTGQWLPITYLSHSLSLAERNYQIYDKELLTIIRAFKAWRHYLKGSPHSIQVILDHKNLTYWKSAQKLT